MLERLAKASHGLQLQSLLIIPTAAVSEHTAAIPIDNPYCSCKLTRVNAAKLAGDRTERARLQSDRLGEGETAAEGETAGAQNAGGLVADPAVAAAQAKKVHAAEASLGEAVAVRAALAAAAELVEGERARQPSARLSFCCTFLSPFSRRFKSDGEGVSAE